MLLRPTGIIDSRLPSGLLGGQLTKKQLALIEGLDGTPEFAGLVASMEADESRWLSFLDNPNAESCVPEPWLQNIGDISPETNQAMKMIIVNILRPDRFLAASKKLIELTFSEEATQSGQVDLEQILENESNARSPLLLVSAPGYDASFMVD
jgi:dynein heavy chain 1